MRCSGFSRQGDDANDAIEASADGSPLVIHLADRVEQPASSRANCTSIRNKGSSRAILSAENPTPEEGDSTQQGDNKGAAEEHSTGACETACTATAEADQESCSASRRTYHSVPAS